MRRPEMYYFLLPFTALSLLLYCRVLIEIFSRRRKPGYSTFFYKITWSLTIYDISYVICFFIIEIPQDWPELYGFFYATNGTIFGVTLMALARMIQISYSSSKASQILAGLSTRTTIAIHGIALLLYFFYVIFFQEYRRYEYDAKAGAITRKGDEWSFNSMVIIVSSTTGALISTVCYIRLFAYLRTRAYRSSSQEMSVICTSFTLFIALCALAAHFLINKLSLLAENWGLFYENRKLTYAVTFFFALVNPWCLFITSSEIRAGVLHPLIRVFRARTAVSSTEIAGSLGQPATATAQTRSNEGMSEGSANSLHILSTAAAVTVAIRDLTTQIAISSKIDESLEKQKNENLTKVKILLLGGADAGKSTILKQMRILHMNGFSADELHSFQKHLRANIVQIFHELAIAVCDSVVDIAAHEKSILFRFAESTAWFVRLDGVQEIVALHEFRKLECVRAFSELFPNYSLLPDNAQYYLPNLTSILSPDFIPTADHIQHLRIPTTSVDEINFAYGDRIIRLIDVGGQRTYRKKWLHYFDGVAAVLFVVSMAAYDQTVDEVDKIIKPVIHNHTCPVEAVKPKKENRLRESARLFGDMLRNKYLKPSDFILFLNKKDLLWSKLPRRPLGKFMNGYKGSTDEEAADFLRDYLLESDKSRKIYSHYTCATDTSNIEFVFKAATDIVLLKNMNKSGLQ